ncbi:hypothetical protein [Streptomyces paradoxus]|uniref:Uncharacterized protein n=1 Tax=Streptomyces paradoxus TaxID=66375 RepID=A0A7W9WM25_9ACTN|nr:hypothetical protein [Streptomyces paradoxus]MBB6081964.1 hypothetical protein [Streptomyces paradoxus]
MTGASKSAEEATQLGTLIASPHFLDVCLATVSAWARRPEERDR